MAPAFSWPMNDRQPACPARRRSTLGSLSPVEIERGAIDPGAPDPADVLVALKERPGSPIASRTTILPAVLDRHCARRLHVRAGRDEKMLSAEPKDGMKKSDTMRSDRRPWPKPHAATHALVLTTNDRTSIQAQRSVNPSACCRNRAAFCGVALSVSRSTMRLASRMRSTLMRPISGMSARRRTASPDRFGEINTTAS